MTPDQSKVATPKSNISIKYSSRNPIQEINADSSEKAPSQVSDEEFAGLLLESKKMLFDLKVLEDDREKALRDLKKPDALVFDDFEESATGQQENVQIMSFEDEAQPLSQPRDARMLPTIEEDVADSDF